jgi:hypothetical protein
MHFAYIPVKYMLQIPEEDLTLPPLLTVPIHNHSITLLFNIVSFGGQFEITVLLNVYALSLVSVKVKSAVLTEAHVSVTVVYLLFCGPSLDYCPRVKLLHSTCAHTHTQSYAYSIICEIHTRVLHCMIS